MTVLQEALSSLGLSRPDEQVALLENMFFEGVFEPEEVWNGLHRLHGVEEGQENASVREAFHAFTGALKQAGAFTGNPAEFRARSLLESELGNAFSVEDMQDWMTYSRQSSYGRPEGVERFQLGQDRRLEEVKSRYMDNARVLGMVDAVAAPAGAVYDESWVQGASRLRMENRLNFLLRQDGVETGKISMVTAGNRRAYAPFDGKEVEEDGVVVRTRREEGAEYLTALAERLGVLPPGDVRLIPVFSADGSKEIGVTPETTREMTEADVAGDVLRSVLERSEGKRDARVTQSGVSGHHFRADTQTTSHNVARALIERIKDGDFAGKPPEADGRRSIRILNVADQPFIPRMQIQVQDIIDRELASDPQLAGYRVEVDTIGKGCGTEALSVIKSDSAALARQQHMRMAQQWPEPRARDTESLLFNNRHMRELQPPAPPAAIIERLQQQPASRER